jgi:hypothetical protein
MLTRHELVYAAWYILIFALVVGWAALRPVLQAPLPASIGAENHTGEREPEIRRVTQRTIR